ncbi:MAG: ATP-binding protein [Algisphaera sp.]
MNTLRARLSNHHAWITTALLAAVFITCTGQQAWYSIQSHQSDAAVEATRIDQAAFSQYIVGFEHQIQGLFYQLDRNFDEAAARQEVGRHFCQSALETLKNSRDFPSDQLNALHDAETELTHWFTVAQQSDRVLSGDANQHHLQLASTAQALAESIELKATWLTHELDQKMTQVITKRTRDNQHRSWMTFGLMGLLTLMTALFIGRLTRRLTAERLFAKHIVDNSPYAILWKDTAGRLLGYNNVFAKIVGLSNLQEGLGKTSRDLGMRPEDCRVFDAQAQYVIDSGKPLLNIREYLGPPENRQWLRISRVPMVDVNNQITGVLFNFTDETTLKASEDHMVEMTDRFAMGLNAAHAGEWEWDLKTGDVEFSDRWLSLIGRNRDEVVPHIETWRSLIHPDDLPSVEEALEEHFSGNTEEYRSEHRLKQPHGGYRWSLSCGRIVEHNTQGQPVRMQGLNLDIEPAKQAEEALRAIAKRADAANEAKSTFLATMSHELRTPLSGVIGMAELLADTPLNARQRSFVETCRQSGTLLLNLINNLLDFSKIEAGHLELEHRPFSVSRCVKSTASVMAVHAHRKHIELDINLAPDLPAMVVGDSNRLRQVLVNLVANAIKFTESGRVKLWVEPATCYDPNHTAIRFSVIDTGMGIPKDKQESLFKPFVQTDASITRRYGGTGLGLAISQALVKAMGGTLAVESELGHGSTFSFTIQMIRCAGPANNPSPADLNRLTGRACVLAANPIDQQRHTQTLADAGMKVVAFTTWNDIQDHSEPFDLLLVDLPAEDPETSAKSIENLPAHAPALRLILTPVTFNTTSLIALPGTVAITKPCDSLQVVHEASELLRHQGDENLHVTHTTPDTNLHDEPLETNDHISVLVVEDDATNRLYLGELLRRQGVACTFAVDGQEAVDRFIERLDTLDALDDTGDLDATDATDENYQLVLMDYHLPIMDGWCATRLIREAEATRSTHPAVILGITAGGSEDDRTAGEEAGLNGWLHKPIVPADLTAALVQHLTSHRPQTPTSDIAANNPSVPSTPPELAPPLDVQAALERCMGDTDFLAAMLDSFADQIPERIEELNTHAQDGNVAAVGCIAHAIKGAAGLVTAFTLRELAATCEALGTHQDTNLTELRDLVQGITQESQRCLEHVKRVRQADWPEKPKQ